MNNNNSLAVFTFKSDEIRFINGKPVANDVAKVLGYVDPAPVISKKVFPQNRSVAKMETLDGKLRDVTVLEEAGIYQLIFSSKLESAQEFQQWVFFEVLPSIRKTGSYSAIASEPKKVLYDRLSKNGIDIFVGGGKTGTTQLGLSRLMDCGGESVRFLANKLNGLTEIQLRDGQTKIAILESDIERILIAFISGDHVWKHNKTKAKKLYKELYKVNFKLTALMGFSPLDAEIQADLGDNPFGLPVNYDEALEALLDVRKERTVLLAEVDELKSALEEAKPKVEYADAVAESSDCVTLLVFAKLINTGRKRLFTLLRQMDILMKNSTLPYQKYIDSGYFIVAQKTIPNGELVQSALVTGKGQVWLKSKIDAFFDEQPEQGGLPKHKFFPLEQPPTGKGILYWEHMGQTASAVADFGGASC